MSNAKSKDLQGGRVGVADGVGVWHMELGNTGRWRAVHSQVVSGVVHSCL